MGEQGLRIEERYRGPPDSGNGGYVCGLVAGFLGGSAEVTLRRPPPLDRTLLVRELRTAAGLDQLGGCFGR